MTWRARLQSMSPLLNTLLISKCHGAIIHKYINAIIRRLRSAVEAKKSSYPLLICGLYHLDTISHTLLLFSWKRCSSVMFSWRVHLVRTAYISIALFSLIEPLHNSQKKVAVLKRWPLWFKQASMYGLFVHRDKKEGVNGVNRLATNGKKHSVTDYRQNEKKITDYRQENY